MNGLPMSPTWNIHELMVVTGLGGFPLKDRGNDVGEVSFPKLVPDSIGDL